MSGAKNILFSTSQKPFYRFTLSLSFRLIVSMCFIPINPLIDVMISIDVIILVLQEESSTWIHFHKCFQHATKQSIWMFRVFLLVELELVNDSW